MQSMIIGLGIFILTVTGIKILGQYYMLQKYFCVTEDSCQLMNKSTTSEMLFSEKGFDIYPLTHFSSRKKSLTSEFCQSKREY